jgi:hypothetical protein
MLPALIQRRSSRIGQGRGQVQVRSGKARSMHVSAVLHEHPLLGIRQTVRALQGRVRLADRRRVLGIPPLLIGPFFTV